MPEQLRPFRVNEPKEKTEQFWLPVQLGQYVCRDPNGLVFLLSAEELAAEYEAAG